MSNHEIASISATSEVGQHYARCKCGWIVKGQESVQAVEDAYAKHLAYIERVKAAMGNKNPSLANQCDYYRMMADDETVPERDRQLWESLASGLEQRLGRNAPAWEDVPLI